MKKFGRLLLAVVLTVGVVGCGQSSPRVPYEIVQRNNKAYSQVIVVSNTLRTEAGLLSVANQLLKDTKSDKIASAFIYDDKQAATNRDAWLNERLSANDAKHHDDHLIGVYWRNANSGLHEITIHLQGWNGAAKKIQL